MNKVEMIDKAIKDLGGVFKDERDYSIIIRVGFDYVKSFLFHKGDECMVCSRDEFEQRKKELKQMNWYDYENQRTVSKPPIGEIVLYDDYKQGLIKVKILGHHPNNGGVWSEAVGGTFAEGNSYSTDSYYCFRPLDWDRLSAKKKLISEVSTLFYQSGCRHFDVEKAVDKLYELGYLKLPENNLK